MQNVSKRTILWIVPIIIIALFWYFYGPQKDITEHEHITYIKQSTYIETSAETFEQSFGNKCNEGEWVYFKTQKNTNVVEFKGTCPVKGEQQEVNLQFIVKDEGKSFELGAMLLNGEQQSEEDRDQIITAMLTEKDVAKP